MLPFWDFLGSFFQENVENLIEEGDVHTLDMLSFPKERRMLKSIKYSVSDQTVRV